MRVERALQQQAGLSVMSEPRHPYPEMVLVKGNDEDGGVRKMKQVVRKIAGIGVAGISAASLGLIIGLGKPSGANADENDTRSLFKVISDYLAAQKAISFAYDAGLEIVIVDQQKLILANSGTVTLNRPDKIRSARAGGFADVEMVFDGKMLTLVDKNANLYVQVDIPAQSTIWSTS